jgi:hypothetical protein
LQATQSSHMKKDDAKRFALIKAVESIRKCHDNHLKAGADLKTLDGIGPSYAKKVASRCLLFV